MSTCILRFRNIDLIACFIFNTPEIYPPGSPIFNILCFYAGQAIRLEVILLIREVLVKAFVILQYIALPG